MIALHEVSLAQSGRKLLDGVSLSFDQGRVTVVIGPNGAGKSTLLRLASGELPPSSGSVTLDGQPMSSAGARGLALRRAVLAQSGEAMFGFTVRELAALGASLLGLDQPIRDPAVLVERALHRVGLAACADRPIDRLSGGERQRAHLARVLVQLWAGATRYGPGTLLLDEPIAAQDLPNQLVVLDIARQHAAAGGAVGIVLHDLNWAAHIADTLVALCDGRIYAQGQPATVLTRRMLADVYRVDLQPGTVSDAVFLLPQLASSRPAALAPF